MCSRCGPPVLGGLSQKTANTDEPVSRITWRACDVMCVCVRVCICMRVCMCVCCVGQVLQRAGKNPCKLKIERELPEEGLGQGETTSERE
jgi:hypothetical protein